MTPISNEKRELIIEAKKRGEKQKDIAKWLKVCEGSVTVIWRLYRETGSFEPAPYPGKKPVLIPEKFEEAKDFVANNPDATLEEIIEELSLPIKKSRLSVVLNEAGLTFKKRHSTQKSNSGKTSRRSEITGAKTKKQ